MALTPIDPTLEMNHNTSAYSAYQASGFPANFTGTSYISTSTTTSVNTAQMDDSMNPITPAHVSASSVKALVPNFTGRWYAHIVPWFGSGSHVNIGVNNNTVGWVDAMLADVAARGFDGLIIDWYGSGRFENNVTLLIQQQIQGSPGLTFSIMVDQGGYGTTAQLETELSYVHSQYLNDPHYMTQGGLPVIYFFGTHSGVDYATAKASIGQATFWIFEGPGSASNAYVDGTFGWPSPFTAGVNASDPYNLAADTSYLTQVAGGKPAVPHISPGFNGTLTKSVSWSLGKYLPRDHGKCWLAKAANLNAHIPSNVIAIQCATWNDWEEGSQIESPIQNDIFLIASISDSTLHWSVSGGTGDETTIAGYRVIAAEVGGAWLIHTEAAGGAKSVDLSIAGLQVGTTYSVYVVAVGVGSVRNQFSNSVSYTISPPPPPPPGATGKYKWIQFAAARQELAKRLADTGNLFWTDVENGLYLIEAMRVWNALTEVWNEDFPFTQTAAAKWYNLATMAGSPRIRTVTDSDLYTLMQYHLLEPPSGGTWTGTSQFTMTMLQGALQRRSDEIIQLSSSHLTQLAAVNTTPLVATYPLSDAVLEPRRSRFLPVPGFGYSPFTLARDDYWVWDRFEPYHAQFSGLPHAWGVIEGPPLTFALDVPPDIPAELDIIALMSGPTFAPPASTLMAIPDDWTWVAKWGALADLLAQESETTDIPRAQFCQQRYMDGLKAIVASNWLVSGKINGLPVDTPALAELDHYSPEWESDPHAWPSVVVAGMDFLAPCPVMVSPNLQGVVLRVVANAPVPVKDDDYVQVSRDTFDAILNYAQSIAMFKQGGAEFAAGAQLLQQFVMAAMQTNTRLNMMGLFPDVMRTQGTRQDVIVERGNGPTQLPTR